MKNRREQLIAVFNDTQAFYQENPVLSSAVEYGRNHTKLYEADDYPELPVIGTMEQLWQMADDTNGSLSGQSAAMAAIRRVESGTPLLPDDRRKEVRLTKNKTFEAAMKLHQKFPDKRIAVLNFASATRPGGGVKTGSSAQEESLCRCSTLFPTLDRKWLWQKYYDVNRAAKSVLHTDACIYSPGVVICKTDESIPQRLPDTEFVTVDVISCAAPNLRNEPANWNNPETGNAVKMDPDELYRLQLNRISHILHIAAYNKADILVLGAFGCGAFENDPHIVAQAFKDALRGYLSYFDLLEFAVYCRDFETENFKAFQNVFSPLIEKESDESDAGTMHYRIFISDAGEFRDSSKYEYVAEFAEKEAAKNYVRYLFGKQRYRGKDVIIKAVRLDGFSAREGRVDGVISAIGEELRVEEFDFI